MFWKKNKKGLWKRLLNSKNGEGLFVLAPMADVTDNAFREVISEIGMPDILYTEFVSADGLASEQGKARLIRDFDFSKKQRPLIAQIFSGNPENCYEAAKLVQKLGFDGIDINMGCPKRNITKQLCGSELTKKENRELAAEIVAAVKKGAPKLDVAVKTRLGWNEIDYEWVEHIFSQDVAVLTFHLRTRKEMSKVPAHWEEMSRVKEIRDRVAPDTLLLGNGDVSDLNDAREKKQSNEIDGVMIGRGIFTNPWLFAEREEISVQERLETLTRHIGLFEANFGPTERNLKDFGKRIKSFYLMKKFLKVYINGFPGAKEMRNELMQINDPAELTNYIDKLNI